MVFNRERALALVCPACQNIEEHKFSLFAISQKPLQLVCSCGFSQGHLRRCTKDFELNVLSISGDRARIRLPTTVFFFTPLHNLYSAHSGQHLGYLGDPQKVHSVVLENPSYLSELSGSVNPEVMAEIIEMLQELAEQQKIRCECEFSSIGIDVYVDRVELVCAYCGSVVQVNASCGKHRDRLAKVTEIIMEPSTSRMLGEWLKPLP